MENGFDVVTIEVRHERSVVAFVVMRAWSRRAVIFSTGAKRGLIKFVDLVTTARTKRHVDMRLLRRAARQPKIRLWCFTETGDVDRARHFS